MSAHIQGIVTIATIDDKTGEALIKIKWEEEDHIRVPGGSKLATAGAKVHGVIKVAPKPARLVGVK